jgi:hypothetical protein
MNTQIPYDCQGNLMGYPERCYRGQHGYDGRHEPIWKDNDPFTTELTYVNYGRGRSSAVFNWQDDIGRVFQMFMTDMDDLLRSTDLVNSTTPRLKWKIRKRGQNYGIALYKE